MVSIIITTYKASDRLSQAIQSILVQTYDNYEIIIIDDNNSNTKEREFTESLMLQYSSYKNIFYYKHKCNMNGAAARNSGLRVAKGDYIAFLDDDDEYYQDRLKKCVECLEKHTDYDAVYTDIDIYKNDCFFENRKAKSFGYCWKELLLNEGLLGTGSNLFFRRNCLADVKGFDEQFIRYQDVEFMLRLLQKHKIYSLNETLVKKNIEATNIPSYEKYKENKMLICNKFAYLINQLNDGEKTSFYSKHYRILLQSAILSCNRTFIKEAQFNLTKYAKIDLKTKIKCMFPRIYRKYLHL